MLLLIVSNGVNSLLNAKAKIQAKTTSGITPLHVACIFKNIEIIKLLVQNGAKINVATTVSLLYFLSFS